MPVETSHEERITTEQHWHYGIHFIEDQPNADQGFAGRQYKETEKKKAEESHQSPGD